MDFSMLFFVQIHCDALHTGNGLHISKLIIQIKIKFPHAEKPGPGVCGVQQMQ